MSLYDVFHSAANTVFTVFKSLIVSGEYVQNISTGWEDVAPVPNTYPVDIILGAVSKEDMRQSRLYGLIQPTDVLALVKGSQIVFEIKTGNDTVKITHKSSQIVTYSVEGFDTDPAGAVYTVLLRNTA